MGILVCVLSVLLPPLQQQATPCCPDGHIQRAFQFIKGRVLAMGVRPGMTAEDVADVLGLDCCEMGSTIVYSDFYEQSGVSVIYLFEATEIAGQKEPRIRYVVKEVKWTPLYYELCRLLK